MGNQLSLITPSSTTFAIDAYVAELKTIQYEKNLGNARFFKTIRGMNDEGLVVVKVFIKPTLDLDLSVYYSELLSKYFFYICIYFLIPPTILTRYNKGRGKCFRTLVMLFLIFNCLRLIEPHILCVNI